MKMLLVTLLASVSLSATTRGVWAQGVHDCDAALVRSTYNQISADHVDARLATLVTEDDYNQISHDAGANAVIYGIPMGGSYKDFD